MLATLRAVLRAAALPCAVLLTASNALAQTDAAPPLQPFPVDATSPSAADLRERLAGKVFNVKNADGSSFRIDFRSNGYYFFDTSTGFRGAGEWRAEDGRMCSKTQGRDRDFICNDARVSADLVHVRRTSGELIRYEPR